MAVSRPGGEAPREDTIREAATTSAHSGVTAAGARGRPRIVVGDIIAEKYVVERTLGMGGMGQVLAAKHVKLGTHVAIKVVHPELATESETVARFLQEAHAMAKLRSEHTVRVLDVGETADNVPYIIMEHLEGRDLGAILLERGPLPVPLALDYIRQACDALVEAHSVGIIHRDLKPQNLFLARRGSSAESVRVLDFGLAKAVSSALGGVHKLTQSGHILGTPHYMAPEQLRAEGIVDERTDVWGLGATLFRLLTREYPFRESNAALACAAMLTREPALIRDVRPDVPEAVAAVVGRCLSIDPARRFQSMRELAAALDQARMLVATPSHAFAPLPAPMPPAVAVVPPPSPSSSPFLAVALAVAGLALLVIAVTVGYIATRPPPSPAPSAPVASAADPSPPTATEAPSPSALASAPAPAPAPAPASASASAPASAPAPAAKPRATSRASSPAATTSTRKPSVYDSL